ncbi:MAG: putative selenate reductase subunit YgfK [Proteobacteria bacterium]|jgi:putative selenate reductase|nr:putative selenate reductase subunit YgfK [Pseudomonadota bacterium]
MYPSTIGTLAGAIAHELGAHGRIFGVPEEAFAPASSGSRLRCDHMGHALDNPLGVAAGPHTQLAQNIVVSYLAGARFVELKTVQILDRLDVTKPCIDMRDLGYNCEWSQELTLEQSFDQYASAFVLVHALARARGADPSGFTFNMSVGYDLAGIRSDAVRGFVDRMRDAGDEIARRARVVCDAFRGTALAVDDLDPPRCISDGVTLSTMHGCPPAEIERIGLHLVEELGLHTTVKLNPTLLGKERLRHLLHDRLGHDGVEVPDEAFAHDPSFEDACAIIASLDGAAKRAGVRFAVKLTNTLETRNVEKALPAKEPLHYMSGRALHPLAAALAALLADRFGVAVPISLSGGVDAFNAADLLACGVLPLTVSSDLLRPGGYGRLPQYLERIGTRLEALGVADLGGSVPNATRLAAYAERAADDVRYGRRGGRPVFSSRRALGLVDCMAAPCRERCPAHQNVPDYLRLIADGRDDDALEVILRDNPLAATTGCACDHPCTLECVRNLLDDPIGIREIKRWAVERAASREVVAPREGALSIGVVGAGPAGLAAAVFCRRLGHAVTVYEARDRLGGTPASAIPAFRLPDGAVARDVERAERLGVRFERGRTLGGNLELGALRAAHDRVFVAVGAGGGRRLGVQGEDAPGVFDAIDFLERAKAGKPPDLGGRAIVVGGGNSAMDAARAARRLVGGGGTVTVVYRRTRTEMPAARDEIEAAEREGVSIEELLAPSRVLAGADGRVEGLECLIMALGAVGEDGRRSPVPTPGRTRSVPADSIVVAIGQGRLPEALAHSGLSVKPDGRIAVDAALETGLPGVFAGGDAVRGASTIVEAVADARRFADSVGNPGDARPEREIDVNASLARKGRRAYKEAGPRAEASRCLGCDDLCALCVTVCPNRANVLYEIAPSGDGIAQRYQTANVADWCNECGNCAAFCPTGGAPYRDKPRVCLTEEAARGIADGAVFLLKREGFEVTVRRGGETVSVGSDDARARLSAIGEALYRELGYLA